MKLEKWTEKASEVLVKAGELAWEYQHGQAEREHMLVALLEQEGRAVAGMVQKGGGDLITARRAARALLRRVPRVQEGNEPAISPRLRKLLDEAWQEKLEPLCAPGFSSFDKVLIEFGECMYPML